MKTIFTALILFIGLHTFGQCDQLKVEKKDFTVTTTSPTKIKEFSLSKIWFNDYSPPASLVYLFLHTKGEYLEPIIQKELSEKPNVTLYFSDSTSLQLRAIIGDDYAGDNLYNYHTVIYLTDEYLKILSSKTVIHFELFSYKTVLSDRKSKKLNEYLNCMLTENEQ